MNILFLNTDNIQPLSVGDNINLFTRSTGNIIAGAATTTLFNINAKNISHTGLTSLTGNTTVSGNVVVSGNIAVGSTNIISADNIQPVGLSDAVNLYTNSNSNITIGSASSNTYLLGNCIISNLGGTGTSKVGYIYSQGFSGTYTGSASTTVCTTSSIPTGVWIFFVQTICNTFSISYTINQGIYQNGTLLNVCSEYFGALLYPKTLINHQPTIVSTAGPFSVTLSSNNSSGSLTYVGSLNIIRIA